MPQSTHDRAVDMNKIGSHPHDVAATGHGKGEHLSGHELEKKEKEDERNAEKSKR